ncbi:hypothetical protein K502DRAFT_307562 [Neoconidiobolus thromboides FSU 785]|nr:hypothetical protein K502DRAFT_307562 [Neoconidiobolus thromboides FSU 785]
MAQLKTLSYALYSGEEHNLCFSPFAWRTQLALKHKGIEFDEIKVRFKDINSIISKLTDNKWKKVPAVQFSTGEVVFDSRTIADDLENKYQNQPKLFPNGTQLAHFLEHYVMANFMVLGAAVLDTEFLTFKKEDQEFLKPIFDKLNYVIKPKEETYPKIAKFLKPIELMLKETPFFEGEKPTYSDYIVFAFLQWFRVLTPLHYKNIIEDAEDKTLFKWFESILDLNNGYARSFPVNTQYGEFALKNN